jgi:RNA polymerase sigma-70 factor (ECF subfamily)
VDNYRLAAFRSTKNYTGMDQPHDEGPLFNLEIQLQSKEVAHALMQLNLQQRSALVLFHYQGLSHRAISSVLDLSSDAVESLLRRSRKKMRENLRI